MSHEDDPEQYKVVYVRTLSGINALASWFHQDWKLDFPDALTAAHFYIERLPVNKRALLRRELEEFLEASAGKSPLEVREAWLALGAGSWPRDDSALTSLTAILGIL
jgi:hypothetical protein